MIFDPVFPPDPRFVVYISRGSSIFLNPEKGENLDETLPLARAWRRRHFQRRNIMAAIIIVPPVVFVSL